MIRVAQAGDPLCKLLQKEAPSCGEEARAASATLRFGPVRFTDDTSFVYCQRSRQRHGTPHVLLLRLLLVLLRNGWVDRHRLDALRAQLAKKLLGKR